MVNRKSILVVGDVMLDTYFSGDVSRISPEAPVPVFWKRTERSVLGGAANVAANLIAADQDVAMMTVVGDDERGRRLQDMFRAKGIDTGLICILKRHTTEKTRFLAANNQQVLRLDVEDTGPLSTAECEGMLATLRERMCDFDLIVVSDYMKGLLTYELTQGIISLAREREIPVVIDVKDPKSEKYDGATLLKPNRKELADLTGMDVSTDEGVIIASEHLLKQRNCAYVLATCGERGMLLVGDGEPYFIDAIGREVFDVTGAGDTTIAYVAACIANGLPIREAVDIANLAASIQVAKVGTSSVNWTEVRERMIEEPEGTAHKVIAGQAVAGFRRNHEGKKIVFTNGCFDILHIGHIRYLQEAAKLGDLLVVGLNSDDSVTRLKGSGRPINSQSERAEMLSALGFVDYVVIFTEDTPLRLIEAIQPDVLVKGADYEGVYVVGTKEVEARGGRLVLVPLVEGKSTTGIITRINR